MSVEDFQKRYGIIGRSKEIKDLVDVIRQVATSDITILIYGESGVGKEVFARAVHQASRRATNALVSVNCGAIPEGILESELFGHKKGAFTGATEGRKGYFEMADGGTLFLDEIAETPITTQVKLLRAIETKEFMRVGSESVTQTDTRFIAATNKDLQAEVDSKRFREDLYFRLKAVTLTIPPLRKRKTDIPELAAHFLAAFQKDNMGKPIELTNDAVQVLMEYHWPGNVRELKNTIETAAALSKTGLITSANLAQLLKIEPKVETHRNLPVAVGKSPEEIDRDFIYRALFELKKDIMELKAILLNHQVPLRSLQAGDYYPDTFNLGEIEKRTIAQALKKTAGNKRKAALLLNISERTLYRKMDEFDLHNEVRDE